MPEYVHSNKLRPAPDFQTLKTSIHIWKKGSTTAGSKNKQAPTVCYIFSASHNEEKTAREIVQRKSIRKKISTFQKPSRNLHFHAVDLQNVTKTNPPPFTQPPSPRQFPPTLAAVPKPFLSLHSQGNPTPTYPTSTNQPPSFQSNPPLLPRPLL